MKNQCQRQTKGRLWLCWIFFPLFWNVHWSNRKGVGHTSLVKSVKLIAESSGTSLEWVVSCLVEEGLCLLALPSLSRGSSIQIPELTSASCVREECTWHCCHVPPLGVREEESCTSTCVGEVLTTGQTSVQWSLGLKKHLLSSGAYSLEFIFFKWCTRTLIIHSYLPPRLMSPFY